MTTTPNPLPYMGEPEDAPELEPMLISRGKVRNVYQPAREPTVTTPTNPLPCGCRTIRIEERDDNERVRDYRLYVQHCALHAAAGETLQDRDRLAAILERIRTATGIVRHTDPAACAGCGCMSLTAEEAVAELVRRHDRLAAEVHTCPICGDCCKQCRCTEAKIAELKAACEKFEHTARVAILTAYSYRDDGRSKEWLTAELDRLQALCRAAALHIRPSTTEADP